MPLSQKEDPMVAKVFRMLLVLVTIGLLVSACAGPTPAPAPAPAAPAAPAAAAPAPAAPAAAAPAATKAPEPTKAAVAATVPAAPAAPAAAKAPIYMGALLPLSEPGAPAAGQLILRGIQMGAEYVNTVMGGSLDGRPIEIVVEDDKGTPEVGASGYRRLVQEKKVAGVTGCYHSSVCLATNEVAKELGVPVIVTQGSNAAITAAKVPAVFRTHLIDPVRATALVDFAKNNGFKKVSIMADNTDFGVGLTGAVKDQGTAAGLDVKATVYDKAAVDLTPELLQIKSWGPDIIFNGGTGNPEHLIIDQGTDIGILPKVPMLATSDWPYRADEYWKLHPKNGVGMFIVTSYHQDMKLSKSGQWLFDAYKKKYGEAPTYSTLNGFGDLVLLAQAAKSAGTTDPKAMVKALETGTFEFWAGTVAFPPGEGALFHQWTPPVVITQYTAANQQPADAKLVYTFNQK
jgi:branched-chain amino acid transport system substrate-binding protein